MGQQPDDGQWIHIRAQLPGETTVGKTSILTSAPSESSFVNASHVYNSNPNVKNIDPRIGLAYDPFADHKTSIRAGFAMYHEPITSRTFAFEAPFPTEPWFEVIFHQTIFRRWLRVSTRQVSILAGTAANDIVWFNGVLPTVNTAPYMMQYNLTVQRQLWLGTVFNIGYAGSTGVHLFAWIDANPSLYLSMLTPTRGGGPSTSEATPYPAGVNPPDRGRRAR